jgi:Flp pilus assembly protein TadG
MFNASRISGESSMRLQFRDNRGQALVEVALMAPLYLGIVLGAFELGQMAHDSIEVQNAARAGSSYGSVNVANATSADVVQAAKNDAPDLSTLTASASTGCVCEKYTYSTGASSFTPSTGTVSCTAAAILSCTEDDSVASQSVVGYVKVTTQATVTPFLSVAGMGQYTLQGHSAMRILPN